MERAEIVRGCLESLALSYRRTVETLEQLTGRTISTIYVVGGGCNNTLLNQMTADATGRQVVTGPVEATTVGNALVQSMTLGEISSLFEARKIVRESFPLTFYEPINPQPFEDSYPRFLQLIQTE